MRVFTFIATVSLIIYFTYHLKTDSNAKPQQNSQQKVVQNGAPIETNKQKNLEQKEVTKVVQPEKTEEETWGL